MNNVPLDYAAMQTAADVNAGLVPAGASNVPIVSTPPMPGQIPSALLESVPTNSIPVGASSVPLVPQQAAQPVQPAVDPSQYVQPQPAMQPAQSEVPQQALANSFDVQKQANNKISKAVADKAVAEDAAYDVQQERLVQQEARMQEMQAEFNNQFSSKMANLDEMRNKLNSSEFTNASVDSERFWKEKGTGQRILAAIAVGLGAGGANFNGGENGALKIIQGAIDKDIEAQKFNIQQKASNMRDQINAGQNMLENLKSKFGSDIQAETAFRILAADQTQNKLKQLAGRVDNVTLQASAQALNAKLEQEKQANIQALKAQTAMQQKLASGDLSNLGPAELAALPKETRELVISERERSVPGFIGRAKDKESASKFQEAVASSKPAIEAVKQLQAFTKDGMNWDPDRRAEAATQLQLVIGRLREPLLGPGTMQKEEYERLLKAVGNPDALLTWGNSERARLNLILKNLENDLDTKAESFGFRRSQQSNIPMKPYQGR